MDIFKSYITKRQIAELWGLPIRTVRSWNLPQPDFNKRPFPHMWLRSTIEKWLNQVNEGLIKKTKV